MLAAQPPDARFGRRLPTIPGRHRLLGIVLFALIVSGAAWAGAALAGTPNTWTTVAPLPAGRWDPAAAGAAGLIYVFGGSACGAGSSFCRTFESFNPRTNRWTSRGNMPQTLGGSPSATTGPNNRIYLLSAGGLGAPGGTLVYDTRINAWRRFRPPPGVQDSAQLVTSNGRIYAVGGRVKGTPVGALSSYNPSTSTWTVLKPFPAPRQSPAAAAGPDGRIYVIGGSDQSGNSSRVDAYNPKTNSWSPAAPLPTPRAEFQAVTGPDGRIYAIGGGNGSRCLTSPCNVVEAYDVRRNIWTATAPLPHPRWLFAAAVGPDGRIYVLGGARAMMGPLSLRTVVDVYTVVPAGQPLPTPRPGPTPVSRQLAPMPTGRQNLALAAGGDGKIYAIGGESVPVPQAGLSPNPIILRTVEAYDPTTNTWTRQPELPAARIGLAATTGPDGRIYVLGGTAGEGTTTNPAVSLASVDIFDPTTHHWTAGTPLPAGRSQLAAVTGTDGRIYAIGGLSNVSGVTVCGPAVALAAGTGPRARPAHPEQTPCYGGPNTVVAYDPRTDTWTKLANLHTERVDSAAAAGRDGRIYVFGGQARNGLTLTSAEVYDPRTNRWTLIARMLHVRMMGFAAATGKDGRIYLIGGCVGPPGNHGCTTAPPSPVDAYDPAHNSWKTIGSTLYASAGPAAATGPDGRIYVAGGFGDGNGHLLEALAPQ